jgi:hypothetical protein
MAQRTTTNSHALEEWCRQEQESLWNDLGDAIRGSQNGVWSIQCSNLARRIVEVARLVGPTPWGSVPLPLLAGGVYAAVLRAGDVQPSAPTDEEWLAIEDTRGTTGGFGLDRDMELRRYSAVRAAIKAPRETNFIRTGEE